MLALGSFGHTRTHRQAYSRVRMVGHHENNIWPEPRPSTKMLDWVWMMEACFDLMVHGQSSWHYIRPEPRPNTSMCDWVWMMEVGFDTILHGQSSLPFSPSSGNWPIYRLQWSKDIIGRIRCKSLKAPLLRALLCGAHNQTLPVNFHFSPIRVSMFIVQFQA